MDLKGKRVLLQLPSGLKPKAKEIAESIHCKTLYIYMGSCFGACDIPNIKGIDAVVQYGHSRFYR